MSLPDGAACAVHPETDARFVCVRCGTFGCEACAFTMTEGLETCRACAAGGLPEAIPWERRNQIGRWRAFWQTTWIICRTPTAFFRTPPTEKGVMWPVIYGVFAHTIGQLLYFFVIALFMWIGGGLTAAIGSSEASRAVGSMLGLGGCAVVGMSAFVVIGAPAQAILRIVFAAAASHGLLAIGKRAKGSFEDTLRAVSYSNAPLVFFFVPLFGIFANWWMWGVELIAIREAHKVGNDWAALTTIGYRIVVSVVGVIAYLAFVAFMIFVQRQGLAH